MSVIPRLTVRVGILVHSRYALPKYVFSPVPGKVDPLSPGHREPCNMDTWRHMQGFALEDQQELVMSGNITFRGSLIWSTHDNHMVNRPLGWEVFSAFTHLLALASEFVSKYQPKRLRERCLHPVIRLHFRVDSRPVVSPERAAIASDPGIWRGIPRLRDHPAWNKTFR